MKKFIIVTLVTLTVSASLAMSKKVLGTARTPAVAVHPRDYPFLEFKELKQFKGIPKDKFDLSSLAMDSAGTIYTISDREKHDHIYKLDWNSGMLSEFLPFKVNDVLDIEAIDICGDAYYVSNEKNDTFYIVKKDQETEKLKFDVSKFGVQKYFFTGNEGFEGMAVDCSNQIMYAVKERAPRFILTIDLKTKTVLKKWTIPETDANDFSDAKFENGFLYVLERISMLVTKIDLKTEQVVAKYSYRNMEKSGGYLFGPSTTAMGEALMLTPTEVWIGFDNNGLKATNQAQKELGLVGKAPVVMRFKRPAGF